MELEHTSGDAIMAPQPKAEIGANIQTKSFALMFASDPWNQMSGPMRFNMHQIIASNGVLKLYVCTFGLYWNFHIFHWGMTEHNKDQLKSQGQISFLHFAIISIFYVRFFEF